MVMPLPFPLTTSPTDTARPCTPAPPAPDLPAPSRLTDGPPFNRALGTLFLPAIRASTLLPGSQEGQRALMAAYAQGDELFRRRVRCGLPGADDRAGGQSPIPAAPLTNDALP